MTGSEPDLDKYELSRDTDSTQGGADEVTKPLFDKATRMFTDSGLTPGTNYWYFLRARDSNMNWSGYTVAGPVKPRTNGLQPTVSPQPTSHFEKDNRNTPSPFNACDMDNAADDRAVVKLIYSCPSCGYQKYRIYRRASSADPWDLIGEDTDGTQNYSDANIGRPQYDYAISGVGTTDEGPNSSTVTVTDTFGPPPDGDGLGDFQAVDALKTTTVLATQTLGPDCTYIQLRWAPSVEQRLVGYHVYRECYGGVVGFQWTGDCPDGWELVSGLTPIPQTTFLDREVGKGVRPTTGGFIEGYDWSFMVTAVLERQDGSRVESQATGKFLAVDGSETNTFSVFECEWYHLTNPDMENKCATLVTGAFPLSGLEHPKSTSPTPSVRPVPHGLEASQGDYAFDIYGYSVGNAAFRNGVAVRWAPDNPSSLMGYYLYYRPYSAAENGTWNPIDTYRQDDDHDGIWQATDVPILIGRWGNENDAYDGDSDGTVEIQWYQYDRNEKTEYKVVSVDQDGTTEDPILAVGWPYVPPPQDFIVQPYNSPRTTNNLRWHDNKTGTHVSSLYRIYRREGSSRTAYGPWYWRADLTPGSVVDATHYKKDCSNDLWKWLDTGLDPQKVYDYEICDIHGTGDAAFESDRADDDDAGSIHTCMLHDSDEEPEFSVASTDGWPKGVESGDGVCEATNGSLEIAATLDQKVRLVACESACPEGEGRTGEGPTPAADGWNVSSLLDGEGSLAAILVGSAPAHIGTADPPWEVWLIWTDHLGSTKVVSSLSADHLTRHSYYPFGERITSAPDFATHEFTGHERDREMGLDYMLARYYNAGIGRFLSSDLVDGWVSDLLSFNKFTYVRNTPIHLTDPTGFYWPRGTPQPWLGPGGRGGPCWPMCTGGTTSQGDGSGEADTDSGFTEFVTVTAPRHKLRFAKLFGRAGCHGLFGGFVAAANYFNIGTNMLGLQWGGTMGIGSAQISVELGLDEAGNIFMAGTGGAGGGFGIAYGLSAVATHTDAHSHRELRGFGRQFGGSGGKGGMMGAEVLIQGAFAHEPSYAGLDIFGGLGGGGEVHFQLTGTLTGGISLGRLCDAVF